MKIDENSTRKSKQQRFGGWPGSLHVEKPLYMLLAAATIHPYFWGDSVVLQSKRLNCFQTLNSSQSVLGLWPCWKSGAIILKTGVEWAERAGYIPAISFIIPCVNQCKGSHSSHRLTITTTGSRCEWCAGNRPWSSTCCTCRRAQCHIHRGPVLVAKVVSMKIFFCWWNLINSRPGNEG